MMELYELLTWKWNAHIFIAGYTQKKEEGSAQNSDNRWQEATECS